MKTYQIQIQNLISHGEYLRKELEVCHSKLLAANPFSIEWDEARTRRDWLRLRISSVKNRLAKLQGYPPSKNAKPVEPMETWEMYNENKPFNYE